MIFFEIRQNLAYKSIPHGFRGVGAGIPVEFLWIFFRVQTILSLPVLDSGPNVAAESQHKNTGRCTAANLAVFVAVYDMTLLQPDFGTNR